MSDKRELNIRFELEQLRERNRKLEHLHYQVKVAPRIELSDRRMAVILTGHLEHALTALKDSNEIQTEDQTTRSNAR